MHRQAVHAVPHLGRGVGNLLGPEPAVHRPPGLAGVVGTEHPGRRDRDEHPLGVLPVEEDRVEAHPARAGLPHGRRLVRPEPGQLVPGLAGVGRPEQRRILDARVDGVRLGQRRLEVPDPGERPGPRRAVVPQMRPHLPLVRELVAHRLPRLAAVVRALDQLAEPGGRLGRVEPVRRDGGPLEVIHLPAPEVGPGDIPRLALPVRRQDERSLPRPHQHSYSAHRRLLLP
jgi:hypothetical protein